MKRKLLITLSVILLMMLWGWFNIWRSPAYYTLSTLCPESDKILTMKEYSEVINSHKRPYVFKNESVVIFGAEHTQNTDDPQLPQIKSSWEQLQPTVTLVEGRLGFLIPYVMNPVNDFGESGYVAALAKSDGAEIYSWELPKSDLILKLLKTYTPEQVALHQILTPYFSNYRFGRPESPNQFVEPFLNRSQYPGLNNVITSVEDIDRIWKRDFANSPDWRETSDQYGLPLYLAQMGDDANMIRNQHLVCIIKELTAQGERVFVICGLSHAVCINPEF